MLCVRHGLVDLSSKHDTVFKPGMEGVRHTDILGKALTSAQVQGSRKYIVTLNQKRDTTRVTYTYNSVPMYSVYTPHDCKTSCNVNGTVDLSDAWLGGQYIMIELCTPCTLYIAVVSYYCRHQPALICIAISSQHPHYTDIKQSHHSSVLSQAD